MMCIDIRGRGTHDDCEERDDGICHRGGHTLRPQVADECGPEGDGYDWAERTRDDLKRVRGGHRGWNGALSRCL